MKQQFLQINPKQTFCWCCSVSAWPNIDNQYTLVFQTHLFIYFFIITVIIFFVKPQSVNHRVTLTRRLGEEICQLICLITIIEYKYYFFPFAISSLPRLSAHPSARSDIILVFSFLFFLHPVSNSCCR